jgi:hypothetical protein
MGQPTPLRIASLGPGEALGWCALVPPHAFVVDAVAATSVITLAFNRERLKRLFEKRPEIGLRVTTNAASALALGSVRFLALWLREMQRDVNQFGGQEAFGWTPQSSS